MCEKLWISVNQVIAHYGIAVLCDSRYHPYLADFKFYDDKWLEISQILYNNGINKEIKETIYSRYVKLERQTSLPWYHELQSGLHLRSCASNDSNASLMTAL